ncbi:glucose import [Tritrichomonas musculus]|uniref:Glucose import n=1 Tax=Tritrichomonas musculus TaxID=1915356 RepID=A0ABR2H176_9EUKA
MGFCVKEIGFAVVIMLCPFLFGNTMCYPSPTAPEIQARHNLDSESFAWSFYNSISALFAIAGPFAATGYFKLFHNSRKKAVFLNSCFGIAFWLLNCLTKTSIYAGIVMRAFLGVIMGAYSSMAPLYLVEIAPEGSSGFFGCLNQAGVVLGMIFFDFIGPSLTYMSLNYVAAATSALLAGLIWIVKESPAVKHPTEEKPLAEGEKKEKVSIWQKKYAFGLISGILMMLFQQFCGVNAILTNLADIMNKSGLELDGNYQGGIASIAQLIAVFISALIIDKIGRKITWIISCSMVIVFMFIFALNTKYDWSNILPLVCIFLYQLGFGLGLGPIPWFIIPEYFDAEVRAPANTIVVSANWIFAFIIIFVWPYMNKGMGMFGSLIFFTCIAIAGLLFGIFCIHDKKNDDAINDDKDDGNKIESFYNNDDDEELTKEEKEEQEAMKEKETL